jgi:16S rRNA (uracil1498-N3)-methyltransferase
MHRFFLSPEQCKGTILSLRDEEAHHALRVVRVRSGDRVTVLDGAGHEYLCQVAGIGRQEVILSVRQRSTFSRLPYRITLIQAVTKTRSMELIVQKAAEFGVERIVPVISERSIIQLGDEAAVRKADKWTAIAIEAIKQCGCPYLPEVSVPAEPRGVVEAERGHDLTLVASLSPGARHPRRCLEAFLAERRSWPASVAVWVGPEGDFTPAELDAILNSGALPITLGRWVLRSETAALYCLSVLSYEMQWGEGMEVMRGPVYESGGR